MAVRAQFRYDLDQVQHALLHLSAAVEQAIAESIRALLRNDVGAAQRIKRNDDEIDERRADIEERVLRIIAAQQPIATDLRFLLACLRIADDLERMGDYAEGIAALVIRDQAEPAMVVPAELELLAREVQALLQTSVGAFVRRDPSAAATLDRADDRVDELNRSVQTAMLRHLQHQPHAALRALHYLFVAHNLERIADRAVNLAERTAFIATGVQHKLLRATNT